MEESSRGIDIPLAIHHHLAPRNKLNFLLLRNNISIQEFKVLHQPRHLYTSLILTLFMSPSYMSSKFIVDAEDQLQRFFFFFFAFKLTGILRRFVTFTSCVDEYTTHAIFDLYLRLSSQEATHRFLSCREMVHGIWSLASFLL